MINDSPNSKVLFARLRSKFLCGGAMRWVTDLVALIYIGVIATVANLTGAYYLLFPELSALSWDVMERPRGRWAGAPAMLALTPALTGLIGTIITRSLPYGFVSVLLTVLASIAVLRILRSPIAPAISAGLLPLVLGVTSWWYPPGILFGTTLLAAISILWKRYFDTSSVSGSAPSESGDRLESASSNAKLFGNRLDDQQYTDALLAAPSSTFASHSSNAPSATATRHLLLPLLFFIAIAMVAVKLTGMRFILFPPLVVILYEMLSHREHCPWVGRPIAMPTACFLSASGGYFLFTHLESTPLVAMLSMVWGIAVLRTLNLYMPPVLAVALLPLVVTNPTVAYPVSIGLGTALASAWFELLRRWRLVETGPSPAAP
jgi:hypothetical protein